MKRFPSLKKTGEYQRVYSSGKSLSAKNIVMYILENGRDHNRLGISVSKRVGNSVVRHGLCRKMREIFRLNNIYLKTGYDIVVIMKASACKADYKMLNDDYIHLIRRHDIILKTSDDKEESK